MKTRSLLVLGVLAALIVVPMVVGFLLPQKYEARVRMTVKRPPADVWAEVSDYHKHPLTGSQMKKVEALPDRNGLPAWVAPAGIAALFGLAGVVALLRRRATP